MPHSSFGLCCLRTIRQLICRCGLTLNRATLSLTGRDLSAHRHTFSVYPLAKGLNLQRKLRCSASELHILGFERLQAIPTTKIRYALARL